VRCCNLRAVRNADDAGLQLAGNLWMLGRHSKPRLSCEKCAIWHVPASFALFRNQAEYGGQRTPYSAGGDVPAGTIYTNGPCEPGDYRWEVVALDRLGLTLATADRVRPFP
jgi:hypothetical protein